MQAPAYQNRRHDLSANAREVAFAGGRHACVENKKREIFNLFILGWLGVAPHPFFSPSAVPLGVARMDVCIIVCSATGKV